ncbi:MAG: hypothetical protein ABSG21_14710 [Spirochaetia bacterium]
MKRAIFVAAITLALTSCVSASLPPGAVLLGDRTVPFRGDHDVIEVGDYDGFFRSLVLVVENNDVELFNLVVVYGNGERERIDTRLIFREGSRSRVIDLEGGKRRIRNVQFTYKTVGSWRDGRARVVLYGMR